jgi:hypothetical protein
LAWGAKLTEGGTPGRGLNRMLTLGDPGRHLPSAAAGYVCEDSIYGIPQESISNTAQP